MGTGETRRAIAAAAAALPSLAARTAKERAGLMRRWFDLMLANQDDLAVFDDRGARQSRWRRRKAKSPMRPLSSSGLRRKPSGYTATSCPGHQADKRILVLRQPVGVVAAITPWNFRPP